MASNGPNSPLIGWTTDEIVENVLSGKFYKNSVYAFIRRNKGKYPHVEAAIEKLNFIRIERELEKYKHLV
ncbi:TPA: hypothetical protein IGZ64_004110 [Escherichia coli]|nr:hypothetical protein [Escherichia coli]